jgi:hypothetical protein
MAAIWASVSCPVTLDAASPAIWASARVPEMSTAGTLAVVAFAPVLNPLALPE